MFSLRNKELAHTLEKKLNYKKVFLHEVLAHPVILKNRALTALHNEPSFHHLIVVHIVLHTISSMVGFLYK